MSTARDWTVRYGCTEWQDQDENLAEQEARKLFWSYCANPPSQGKRIAEYIILEDDQGKVVDSCSVRE